MTAQTITTDTIDQQCSPAGRVTRSLLGYGVIAGLFYVAVSLAQALTRDGFRLDEHAWSLLENGGLGWIQITNFILTGLMTVAAAAGLRRAITVPVCQGELRPAVHSKSAGQGECRIESVDYCC